MKISIALALTLAAVQARNINDEFFLSHHEDLFLAQTGQDLPDVLDEQDVLRVKKFVKDESCWQQQFVNEARFGGICADGLEVEDGQCRESCADGYEFSNDDCYRACPSNMTDNGHSCIKTSTGSDWLGQPFFEKDCPEGFHAMEGDRACLKSAYHPKMTEPLLLEEGEDPEEQGYERDSHTGAMWRKKCGDDYYRVGDFCFSRCPAGLEKCGLICMESDFVCTQAIIDKSLVGFTNPNFSSVDSDQYKDNVLNTQGHWCELKTPQTVSIADADESNFTIAGE